MKLSELVQTFGFHDSPLLTMAYDADRRELSLTIELLNYDQTWYTPDQPEMVTGKLVFHGVSEYTLKAETPIEDDTILDFDLIEPAANGQERVRVVVAGSNLNQLGGHEFKSLEIAADSVDWVPLDDN